MNKFKFKHASVVVFFVLLGAPLLCSAQNKLQPISPVKAPQNKTLIVETLHPYTVFEYDPKLLVSSSSASIVPDFSNPEATARTYFGALKTQDFDLFTKSWNSISISEMTKNGRILGREREDWRSIWRGTFAGKEIYATHWINYGKYVLIGYRVGAVATSEALDQESTLVLTQEGNQWKLTQELKGDALLSNWKTTSGRVRQPSEKLLSR